MPEVKRERIQAGPPASGTAARPGRTPRLAVRRHKRALLALLGVFLVVIGYVGATLTPYLTAPGTDPINARVAEWGRDHHLSWAVSWLENQTYKPPPVGGALDPSQLARLRGPGGPAPNPTVAPSRSAVPLDLPAAIAPLASPPLPGEGQWHPLVLGPSGVPLVEGTALRPDAQHTSELAYVAWMNQKALTFALHPGYQQPGGSWQTPDQIPPGARTGLVATWNGGFKINPDDSLGGYYAEGRTVRPLVAGKAAEVFYRDGSIRIGQWRRDATMGPDVAAVRENLSPLVDGGRVMVGPGAGSSGLWGYTISNAYFVARSGVGMTANGDIVYVGGGALSVYTLAQLLKQAGAIYAMELDINPSWVSFMTYGGSNPTNPTPSRLWDFAQSAARYYQPSSRDFVAVYRR
jgi:hypothetical protein